MQDSRSQTLQALAVYIEKQKVLLTRTQSDIERLRELRERAKRDPENVFTNLEEELRDNVFRLSQQEDCLPSLPEPLDWTLFSNKDPAIPDALAYSLRQVRVNRNKPPVGQQSELSSLQKLVKDARTTFLDPLLAAVVISDSEDENETVSGAAKRKKDGRYAQADCNKRRKAKPGLTVSSRPRTASTIRKGIDESMDVDVIATDDVVPMNVDSPMTTVTIATPPTPFTPSIPLALSKPSRLRKPSRAKQESDTSAGTTAPTRPKLIIKIKPLHIIRQEAAAAAALPPPQSPILDNKTVLLPPDENNFIDNSISHHKATYNQAWTVSEQHLLERLLEEIQGSEKNRWKKISTAMNGRRTPQQVASRAQKYFKKLEQFGATRNGAGEKAN